MPKVHVKKDDTVYILSGRDRGKTGKVLEVDTKNNKVKVDGVNIVKKHKKPRPPKEAEGGIKEEPAFIHASNVKITEAKGKAAKPKAKAEKAKTASKPAKAEKAEKAAPAEKAEKAAAPEKKAKAKSKAKEK